MADVDAEKLAQTLTPATLEEIGILQDRKKGKRAKRKAAVALITKLLKEQLVLRPRPSSRRSGIPKPTFKGTAETIVDIVGKLN